jgi:GNAT superfamily N-acetyltransferase
MSYQGTTRYSIRPAQPDDAAFLTGIALRAKAHWGYDDAFMAAARHDLIVTAEQLMTDITFVLEQDGVAKGFYKLRPLTPHEVELTDLFLDPTAIGQGLGRALWEHALATASQAGYLLMSLESDPYAEGFYLHMGAQRIGEVESSVVPGRRLPRMSYSLVQEGEDGDSERRES